MSKRYAVYFSPDEHSPLGQYGQSILARTPQRQRTENACSNFTDQDRWHNLTKKPSHYGFHATLKAPFEPISGLKLEEIRAACKHLASQYQPIKLAELAPRRINKFAALTLPEQPKALEHLASNCVRSLENFRAPISKYDLQRRQSQMLSDRQHRQLEHYGYPYIFEDFQFHLTLSDQLSDDDHDFLRWLEQQYAKLVSETPLLDRISLFAQTDRSSAFTLIENFCFL